MVCQERLPGAAAAEVVQQMLGLAPLLPTGPAPVFAFLPTGPARSLLPLPRTLPVLPKGQQPSFGPLKMNQVRVFRVRG